jgi:hypothetical protein
MKTIEPGGESAAPGTSGHALRPENVQETVALAEGFGQESGVSRSHLLSALILAPDLSANEKLLLMFYVDRLQQDAIDRGEAFLFIGNAAISICIELDIRTLQKLNAALEAKQYIVRRYDSRNRRFAGAGIDLRPTLARHLRGDFDTVAARKWREIRARREGLSADTTVTPLATDRTPRDDEPVTLNPSPLNLQECIARKADSKSGRKDAEPVIEPGTHSGAATDPALLAVSPKLRDRLSDGADIGSAAEDLLQGQFPELNLIETWRAIHRDRPLVAAKALILLLENDHLEAAKVQKPAAWLRYFLKPDSARFEFEPCLEKIRAAHQQKPKEIPPIDFEAVRDQRWREVLKRLEPRLGSSALRSWLLPLELTERADGTVTLVAPSAFHRDYVMRDFLDPIRVAFGTKPITIESKRVCGH